MAVFSKKNYREILSHQIELNRHRRGYQSLLATQAGCHRSYISQVLSGQADLTADQCAKLAKFWNFNEAEAEYFLTLLQLEKCTSEELRDLILRRIHAILKKNSLPAWEVQDGRVLPEHLQARYYTQWYHSAVHMMITSRSFQDPVLISKAVDLPLKVIEDSIALLSSMNLIFRDRRGWKLSHTHTLLPKDSPYLSLFQTQWRQRAIARIQNMASDRFSSTQLMHLNVEDVEKARSILAEAIQKLKVIAEKSDGSKEDKVVVLTLDLLDAGTLKS